LPLELEASIAKLRDVTDEGLLRLGRQWIATQRKPSEPRRQRPTELVGSLFIPCLKVRIPSRVINLAPGFALWTPAVEAEPCVRPALHFPPLGSLAAHP